MLIIYTKFGASKGHTTNIEDVDCSFAGQFEEKRLVKTIGLRSCSLTAHTSEPTGADEKRSAPPLPSVF